VARLRAPDAFEPIAHARGELVQVAGAALAVAIVVAKTPATPIPAAIEDTRRMRFRFIASTLFPGCVAVAPPVTTLRARSLQRVR